MAKSVVGLFDSQSDAQAAYRDLESAGFGGNNVSYITSGGGQLRSTLSGAGIPDQDAQIYADGVQQGGALLVLQAIADNDAGRAADILDRHNVVDISDRVQGYQRMSLDRTSTRTGGATANTNLYEGGSTVIPIIQEELRVGKREVESGGVRVNTRVEETPVNEQVTLREEEVHVERRPVSRPVAEGDLNALQQGSFEVRERDEEAIVDKQARVVEEVHVKKDVQERTQTINDTVRRTDVDVDQIPGQTRTSASTNEGMIERGGSTLGNAAEDLTGADLDRDGDTGKRDRRNNH